MQLSTKMGRTSTDTRITKLSHFLIFALSIPSAIFPAASVAYEPDSWYIRNDCHRGNCRGQVTKVKCSVNGQLTISGHRYEIGDGVEFHWLGGLAATYMRYRFEKDGSTSYRDFVGRKWSELGKDGIYKTDDGQIVMKCTTVK